MINKIKTFIGKHPKFFTTDLIYIYFMWICLAASYTIDNPVAANIFALASIGLGISSMIVYFKKLY